MTNTDFVGTLAPQGCGFTYDGENDGHGGYLATGMVSNNNLPGWLAISQPDIVMMELGTNDVWSSLSTSTILAAFTTLVGQMRAQNPVMTILVAQITPMNPSGCTTCYGGVVALNAAIPAWAAGITTAASPVSVVDCWTGYNTTLDTGDGVHPNDAGNTILANDWYAPLSSAIVRVGGTAPVTVSASSTKTSTTSTTTTTTSSKSSTLSTSTVKTSTSSTKTSSSATSTSTATQILYGQCGKSLAISLFVEQAKPNQILGGVTWSGPFLCAAGSVCTFYNTYYSQCIPA